MNVKNASLLHAACLLAGALCCLSGTPSVHAQPPGPDKAKPGFLVGACDWTIGKRTDPGAFALARALGLDGVQVDFGGPDKNGRLQLFDKARQAAILKAQKESNVRIASLAMGTLNTYPLKSDPRAEGWVSQAIDIAKAMKMKVILLAFFGNGDLKNDKAGTDKVIEKLKRLAPKAEKAGVVLGIESWLSVPELRAIIDRIGSPAVKVYYDLGNAQKMGYDIYEEMKALGKTLICEIHAKDYQDVFGKGAIDFPRARKVMDAIGYRGWIVVESVKLPLGRDETVKRDAAYLRSVFPRRISQ